MSRVHHESTGIVDAHIHLWDLNALSYPWLTTEYDASAPFAPYRSICRNFLIPDLLADTTGFRLKKAVHINAGMGHADPVLETAWLQDHADKHRFKLGIIAAADLTADRLPGDLERHAQYRGFRGVRMLTFDRDVYASSRVLQGLKRLESADLVCDVDVDLRRFDSVLKAALQCPNLLMIIGHAGLPTARSPEYFRAWSKAMQVLASAENIMCKISGFGMYDHAWTKESIAPWVESCLEAFGVGRCMFASNWPVDSLFSSYVVLFQAYDAIAASFGREEKQQLFSTNAEQFYRI